MEAGLWKVSENVFRKNISSNTQTVHYKTEDIVWYYEIISRLDANGSENRFSYTFSLDASSERQTSSSKIPGATDLIQQLPSRKEITLVVTPTLILKQPINHVSADSDKLITKYAAAYGVDDQLMMRIAKCESGFNTAASNGPYGGMYQFHSQTWISNRTAMGLNPDPNLRFNAEEAIRTAAYKIARDGAGAWPVCGRV